jgi:hypothetical protein
MIFSSLDAAVSPLPSSKLKRYQLRAGLQQEVCARFEIRKERLDLGDRKFARQTGFQSMEGIAPGHSMAAMPATMRPARLGPASLEKIDRIKTQKNCMSGPKDLVT